MTWMQISECLPAWLSAEIAKEGPDAETPGQVREEVVNTTRRRHASGDATLPAEAASPTNGRGRRAHPKASKPLLGARRPMLSVIEGGGPARAQGGVRPGRLRNAGGNARELRWVVVEGGRHGVASALSDRTTVMPGF